MIRVPSQVHYVIMPAPGMNLVPAPALCASQDDMYDTATHQCQVRAG
jgi:hypothetical protein